MRLVLRFLGMLLLAVGIVFAVGDIARSLADETAQLLTVQDGLGAMGIAFDPASFQNQTVASAAVQVAIWPISVTAGVAGLVLLILGRRRRVSSRARYAR